MIGSKKNKFKRCCTGILALSVLVSNAQIVFAEEINNEIKSEWNLVWSDEFNGNELDLTKWSYEKGNWIVDDNGNKVDSGWGNNELEYYTEGDNLEVKDGNLVITARKEEINDPIQGDFDYTSSRIVTRDNYSKKYGRFEARMKLPEGNGLWPAFWIMPQDNAYGAWAASGEIDIMEARGNELDTVEGTIHYGGNWPTNKYTGKKYDIPNGGKITDFHDYAVEWEPGEIRWYVDGVLCNTQKNWYSIDENGQKYSFPAPFDQDFYLILNLALGGWFAGMNPDEDFTQAEMLVDYVRVYDKVGGYEEVTEEPEVEKEPLPEGAKIPIDDNYVYDVNFENDFNDITSGEKPFNNYWNFLRLPDFGGEATIDTEKIDDKNFAKINVTKGGAQAYSVQLIQNITMTKGHTYKLSYDAKSSSNRDISVKVSGGEDRGYATYSDNYADSLTSDIKHFEHVFTMTADSDAKARLEFNVGLSTNPVWIGNVVVEETEIVENYDTEKEPLKDGNYIYNGTFDKGRVDRKTYWNLDSKNEAKADYSVAEDTRELFINVENGGSDAADVVLNQKGIKLVKNGEYTLTFNARASEKKLFNNSKNIRVVIKDSEGNIVSSEDVAIENEMKEYTVAFNMGENTDKNGTVEFLVGGDNAGLYLDNVLLKNNSTPDLSELETFPLKNGDFTQELAGWEEWSVVGATSNVEEGKAVINIPNKFWESGDGSETWAVQFKQTGLQLYDGLEYILSFEASSTIDREIELVAQNSGYYRVFEDKISLDKDIKKYTYSFVATGTEIVELNFLLGKYADYDPHSITIDNVILEVKNPSTNKVQNNKFDEGDTSWRNWSENSDVTSNVIDGKYEINLSSLGNEFWGVQLFQNGLNLENGKSYRLVFDMASSIPRTIDAIVENDSKALWKQVDVTSDLSTYALSFVYNGDSNELNKLNFCLGAVEGQDISIGNHTITLDNVYLYEIADLSADEPAGPQNISTMEATQGPDITVGLDGGCGFTFPTFNGGNSKFDDIKNDLQVLVKENNEYIPIESSKVWEYDKNFGHFWDGDGGYWFNPVKETTYVKLVSKANPNVFIEYTLIVGENVPVIGVKLNKTSIDLAELGDTETLIATVLPENATNKNITWTSSDKNVATVNENGIVTAVGKGTAKVIAITIDGNKVAECTVNVNSESEDNEELKYGAKKISDTEVEFFIYQEGIKEGDQVILLCSKNDGPEKGFPMVAEGNKLTFILDGIHFDGLQDGDRINYKFNVIIDGVGNLIEDCPVYIHKIDTLPPTTEDEDVIAVEEMINSLPENITLENKAAVEAARAAYNALTDKQKMFVSKELVSKLENAEDKIIELEKEDNNSSIINPDNNSNNNEQGKLPQTGGVNSIYLLFTGVLVAITGVIFKKKNKEVL